MPIGFFSVISLRRISFVEHTGIQYAVRSNSQKGKRLRKTPKVANCCACFPTFGSLTGPETELLCDDSALMQQ